MAVEEEREVVVVGGGIAGLAAAWRLRHRDVLLLEAGDRLGGRLRSERRGAYWLSYGAHLFPGPGSLVDGMIRDCGLATAPVTGSMMGLAAGARTHTPGRVFDLFTNQAHTLRNGARAPGGSLMLFAGGHGAAALLAEPDEAIVARFLADLHDLYPQTRGLIADARVQSWTLGNVYAHPGRHALQPALEGPLGPHANLHLAGDYFAELGNMEAAARTGVLAAERIDDDLRGARDG